MASYGALLVVAGLWVFMITRFTGRARMAMFVVLVVCALWSMCSVLSPTQVMFYRSMSGQEVQCMWQEDFGPVAMCENKVEGGVVFLPMTPGEVQYVERKLLKGTM
jgi:hypothetical protein